MTVPPTPVVPQPRHTCRRHGPNVSLIGIAIAARGETDMAPNIEEETVQLARAIARHTGESPAQAVVTILRERPTQPERLERHSQEHEQRIAEIMAITEHCASLPILDARHPDEILGYDEYGLPHR